MFDLKGRIRRAYRRERISQSERMGRSGFAWTAGACQRGLPVALCLVLLDRFVLRTSTIPLMSAGGMWFVVLMTAFSMATAYVFALAEYDELHGDPD